MRGYAGALVFAGDDILLVQEPDFFTGEPMWTFPTGRIEDGESPEGAATRELAEEAGCDVDPANLSIIATVAVEHDGQQLSASWNYTATIAPTSLAPGHDPDEIVTDARWFERNDAVKHLSGLQYSPKREPALRYLLTGDLGLHWRFELVDPSASVPEFRWSDPLQLDGS